MKFIALSGSYREDGVTEQAAKALLEGAKSKGAQTSFVALRDKNIQFCTNCRHCMQQPGEEPGECTQADDMKDLIRECLASDVLVIVSPINFYSATAMSKKFLERLVPMGYWSWDMHSPKMRFKRKTRRAVLMASSAMPAIMLQLLMPRSMDVLKHTAESLGAKVVKRLRYGLVGMKPHVELSPKALKKAFDLGAKLATGL
jgi:putative NADPH-quinone reductase